MYPDDKTPQSHGLEGGVEVVNKWQFPYEESGCIGNKYINTWEQYSIVDWQEPLEIVLSSALGPVSHGFVYTSP